MAEKIAIAIIGIILGMIISRLITHLEVSMLKQQLFESEEENDKLIAENKKLRDHNCVLYDKLSKSQPVPIENIPDFGKW